MKRPFRIQKESVSCHCCFDYTILDADDNNICECFDEANAIIILEALNDYTTIKMNYKSWGES